MTAVRELLHTTQRTSILECAMVSVGTAAPDEARDVVDISLAILAKRISYVELQKTRSKKSLR
jgi:hypothetical protein